MTEYSEVENAFSEESVFTAKHRYAAKYACVLRSAVRRLEEFAQIAYGFVRRFLIRRWFELRRGLVQAAEVVSDKRARAYRFAVARCRFEFQLANSVFG